MYGFLLSSNIFFSKRKYHKIQRYIDLSFQVYYVRVLVTVQSYFINVQGVPRLIADVDFESQTNY